MRALEEVRRALKAGGRLCILDVTADNRLVRWMRRTRQKEPEHVKYYSSKEYTRMFGEAGMKTVMSKTVLPPVIRVHVAEK